MNPPSSYNISIYNKYKNKYINLKKELKKVKIFLFIYIPKNVKKLKCNNRFNTITNK